MGLRSHEAHLRRAGILLEQAERMLAERRPLVTAAAAVGESAPFPVWVIDREHRILWANREFEILAGIKLADIRGMTFAEAWGPRYDALSRDDEVVMEMDWPKRYRGALDGASYTRTFHKWPIHSEVGTVAGMVGVVL